MDQARYAATVIRSGKWWAIEFADHPGIYSQCRKLADVPEMAADALAFTLDITVGEDQIDVDVQLDAELDSVIRAATQARHEADEASRRATSLTRDAARAANGAGLTVRDIGALLGVSHQYAAKLIA